MKKLSLFVGMVFILGLTVTAMAGLRAPTENVAMQIEKWLDAQTFEEEIGWTAVLSHKNVKRVKDIYACDPLSNFGLIMDTTGKVAEIHYVHDQIEQENEYKWKVNVGSQKLGLPTIEYVAQSYVTRAQQQLFQFGADGMIWLCGQPTDVEYPDLTEGLGDCPLNAYALEIKVRMYPETRYVTFQIINRGIQSGFNKLYGPYELIPEIAEEGIDRCIVKARPDSGICYIDGVICQGNSLTLPTPQQGGGIFTRD